MADRDALIVICWLVILILVFFECFHRKLKARFGGEIRPPPNTRHSLTSFPSDEVIVGGSSSLSGSHFGRNFHRGDLLPPTLATSISVNRGTRFSGPVAMTSTGISHNFNNSSRTKEVCRIPMMSMMMPYDCVEEEEPPPTYEEAISYAKLLTKFQSAPYGDASDVVQCDGEESANSDGVNSGQNNNATSIVIPTASSSSTRTTTTAIFVNEEETDEEDEDVDDSSSSQSANDSDEEGHLQMEMNSSKGNKDKLPELKLESESNKSINRNDQRNSNIEQYSGGVQCNMILTSSSSTSKNLDRIDSDCNENFIIGSGCYSSKSKNLPLPASQQPPKLHPPPLPAKVL